DIQMTQSPASLSASL
nr:prolactin-binding protein, PRL-BP, IgG1 light chain=27 kda form {N-terminal} [rats, serum, Peptide Partial, 15 aa] [Rattus sp.]